LPGSWDKISDRDTAGGMLIQYDESSKAYKQNIKWCQNPQFLLKLPQEALGKNAPRSVDIKLVLRRTDRGASNIKAGSKKSELGGARKSSSNAGHAEKKPKLGIAVCRAVLSDKDAKAFAQRRRIEESKTNALGVKLAVKESSLKMDNRRRGHSDSVNGGGGAEKDSIPERKNIITKKEWSLSSDFTNDTVASLLIRNIDVETLSEGLLIIPSLEQKGVKGSFVLEVHSDFPVVTNELTEARSKTISGEWVEGTSGGSHLHPDWKKNPKFHLKLNCSNATKVQISVSRPEKEWKSVCLKDSIGCMMGFYLMQGRKPNRDMGFISHDGKAWNESPFVPLHNVSTPQNFVLDPLADDEVYCIMPATFEPGKTGSFFLNVVTEADFSLKVDKGEGGLRKGRGSAERKEIERGMGAKIDENSTKN
jgi:hypothetical protein